MAAIDSPEPVSQGAFRASLAQLKDSPIDPCEGLFGPTSVFWEVNRHTLVYFLGAIQSVQMQLCHPWVATAVFEHSKIMHDPRRRAQLTYIYLWSLIYGDLELVSRKAQALFAVHARIQGEVGETTGAYAASDRYEANEVHALLWVHVTAFYCRVRLYEQLVRKLSSDEKDRFVREAKRYAYCFGIPDAVHPQSWSEVEAYVTRVTGSAMLARTEAGLTISKFLERSLPAPLRAPVWAFLCTQLPERIQELLDLPGASAPHNRRATWMRRLLWLAERVLPARLAYVPAWHEARQRLAGKQPDWLTTQLNKIVLGVPRLVA